MNDTNPIILKSKLLAITIVKIYRKLTKDENEFILSKQLVRSGTSVGANVIEAQQAFSNNDFYFKMNISLKEASETKYWLELLYEAEYIQKNDFEIGLKYCNECIAILISIVKNKEINLKKK